jgi:hypothetical protein
MALRPAGRIVIVSLVAGGIAVPALRAGPLNPPAGPIASTSKPLAEIEPRIAVNATNTPGSASSVFVISQPGSYYLSGNVTGVSGKNGVEIASARVTLDLNGFTLTGVPGSFDGVQVSGSGRFGTTIRNGTASLWGGNGVNFGNALSYAAEDLHADNNGAAGIVGGFNGHISRCAARSNGTDGIQGGDPTVIESCSAVSNTGAGIRAVFGESTITNCVSQINTGPGIQVNDNCLVSQNQCSSNAGPGILATSGNNRIDGNNIEGQPAGFGLRVTGTGNLIIRNSVADAATPYDIAANNRYGSIVNISAGGTPAVSGATAASTLTTTDAWANFAY